MSPRAGYPALTTGRSQQPPPLTVLAESLLRGGAATAGAAPQPLTAPAALPAQGIVRIP
jgi:hypothetical protein